jgi:biotin carboxyl carrier protein
MKRWYPLVVSLSRDASPHLRRTAAWTMGKDTQSASFRTRLLELLKDGDLHVRRAAAVSLSAFQDPAARKELVAAIQPHAVVSTVAGSANPRIMVKDTTVPETAVARVGETFVEAGVFGTVTRVLIKDGEPVSAGQTLVEVTPPGEEIRDLLRALSKVGIQEDLPAVRPYLENSEEQVRKEAASAMRIIERRGNSTAGVRIQ